MQTHTTVQMYKACTIQDVMHFLQSLLCFYLASAKIIYIIYINITHFISHFILFLIAFQRSNLQVFSRLFAPEPAPGEAPGRRGVPQAAIGIPTFLWK